MIRPATSADAEPVWEIIEPVIREGETYTINRDISREDALAYWMDVPDFCFVIEVEGRVQGTYYLKANQSGGGSHVCNCGYMVSSAARGQGLARKMCEHSLTFARESGFEAMQFNFVIATNVGAIGLWQKLGFETVGCLPDSFRSPANGLVDAFVMFRKL